MKLIQSNPFFNATGKIYTVEPGVTRQFIGYDNSIMMVKVIFEQGAVGVLHKHPHSQTSYIISGVYEVTVGDETQTLSAGDGFYAAPNTLHGLKCIEAGELIDAFSPVREDFLKTI